MTSHEYADLMIKLAEFLKSKPTFQMPACRDEFHDFIGFYGDKDGMIAAVKSLGAGQKQYSDEYLKFIPETPASTHLELSINRNSICRLVRAAEYDCEPLLSPEEDSQIGGDLR